ncbi:MAG: hypothetical protein GX782_11455 [Gammaproteobacteria bacterium]|nr:hypothetical protein [Gammaproteobacteria bacterium]
MNKKEIRSKVKDLISSEVPRSEVFSQLSGQGLKDSQLAYLIASHPDPFLCHMHDRKVNFVITLMFIQSAIAFLAGFGIGASIGPNAQWIVAGLCALIPLLFAFGFYKHKAGAYNAYIILAITQMPRQLEGFTSSPIATSVGLAIGVSMLAYVWYVRQKIFPSFSFFAPKKIKGQYVFAS